MVEDHDIVIVGSGFGASVMAARLGAWLRQVHPDRHSVLVLERGNDHTGEFDPASGGGPLNAQGNRFRHTLDPTYLADVGQLFTDPDGTFRRGVPSMNVIAGTGLGGGSNLYLGVSLRAPREIFEQVQDGHRRWPAEYTREALEPFYARVEEMLRVHRMAWTDAEVPHWQLACKRDLVFAEGCRAIGATAVPLKLATHEDANEGWWSQGQRFRGRQTLTRNYLREAREAGVRFASGSEVLTVAPGGPGYVVRGIDHRVDPPRNFEIACRILVLGAGAVGTAGILLRSEGAFTGERELDSAPRLGRSPNLGRNLSGNGDYGVSGTVGPGRAPESHKGKPMSSFCPSFWPQHKFIVIPYHNPPLYLAQGQPSTLLPPRNPLAVGRGSTVLASDERGRPVAHWGAAYKERLASFSERILTMGCLALDDSEGEVRLGPGGATVQVVWRQTSAATEARWSEAVTTMRQIYEALGGEMFLDAYRKDGTVNTAHPLGSVRMASEPERGIVNALGESFSNPNLFVVDGAILPSALGVNPSLTIAAVAERIAERLVNGDGTLSLEIRLAPGI